MGPVEQRKAAVGGAQALLGAERLSCARAVAALNTSQLVAVGTASRRLKLKLWSRTRGRNVLDAGNKASCLGGEPWAQAIGP